MQLLALVVPTIATPITNPINTEVLQLPHLQTLPLANPVTTAENSHLLNLTSKVTNFYNHIPLVTFQGRLMGPTVPISLSTLHYQTTLLCVRSTQDPKLTELHSHQAYCSYTTISLWNS